MLTFHVWVQGQGGSADAPLSVSFDDAFAALAALPRLFIEPDGSFVWTSHTSGDADWQVDGNLIDRGDVLACVELKGRCPESRLTELLTALGWPDQPVRFQLVHSGATLDEPAFRRLAAGEAGAR
jgi:hypothetical protein